MPILVKAITGGKLLLKVGNSAFEPLPPPKPPAGGGGGPQPLPPPKPPAGGGGGFEPLPPPTPPAPGTLASKVEPDYPTPLQSQSVLRYDIDFNKRYTECATDNSKHIARGQDGPYVFILKQYFVTLHDVVAESPAVAARIGLLKFDITANDSEEDQYTAKFANTVQNFKARHNILGPGQKHADDIVGIKTMLRLDALFSSLETEFGMYQ